MIFINKLHKIISKICKFEFDYFLNKKNVIGVGYGYKVKNAFRTKQLCIQVLVSKKFPESQLSPNDIVPSIFKGIPTDIVETGSITPCSLRERIRPIKGGYNIGPNLLNNEGTAGCLVTNGVLNFVLSTNHVIAAENTLDIRYPITQPSHIYGGRTPNDIFATLHKYIPLREVHGRIRHTNLSDCALGLLTNSSILSSQIAFIGKLNCVKSPTLNTSVKKVGSSSELTEGLILSTDLTMQLSYESGKQYLFKDVILTSSMGTDGDSGSILVNNNNCALGLLFAQGNQATAYNRLDTILDQLDVHLVT